jgi:CopG family nickel-responsive transcriptional regulator
MLMGKTIRFGVSLDSGLLEKFDRLCEEKSYQTRSEAIRDLIRGALVQQEWEDTDGELAGTLSLVYDHHASDLAQRLTEIQHDAHGLILSTLHVHLDHDNCLEVLVLRGPGRQIRSLAQRLISTKGVKHGRLGLTTTGRGLA